MPERGEKKFSSEELTRTSTGKETAEKQEMSSQKALAFLVDFYNFTETLRSYRSGDLKKNPKEREMIAAQGPAKERIAQAILAISNNDWSPRLPSAVQRDCAAYEAVFGPLPEEATARLAEVAQRFTPPDARAERHDDDHQQPKEHVSPTRPMRSAEELQNLEIPEHEYVIFTSRSGGKGGQRRDKTETQTGLRFSIGGSATLSEDEKAALRAHPATRNRVNDRDELVISEQRGSTQGKNRKLLIEKFHDLLRRALAPRKERIPTKPSRAAKKQRVEEKRQRGRKKAERRKDLES